MIIDQKLLSKLENLSYLKIETEKRAEIIFQLEEILEFVKNLNELNTDGLSSRFSLSDEHATLREDIVNVDKNINVDILKHAPRREDNFFFVAKIIE